MTMIDKKIYFVLAALLAFLSASCSAKKESAFVKIGILHSLTGPMAQSEAGLVNAEKMAVDEINKKGGVLGKQIKIVQADGKSEPQIFAEEARRLLTEENVATIFGCWTSASRKEVKKVVEEPEIFGLLWYPLQYEGMEASPNIMYTGAAPNQQIVPAVEYCFEKFGGRMYLVGSDYVFPRTANRIINARLYDLGGECMGESYVPLDATSFEKIVQEIKMARPDIIMNTINGESNKHFFTALKNAGITPKEIPVMSFSVSEEEVEDIGVELIEGNFASWNYFQSISSFNNKNFVQRYKDAYGTEHLIGDPMEAAYIAVYLWAAAAEKAQTFDVESIRMAAKNLTFDAPEGLVKIDGENQHLQKRIRIGRINSKGLIDEIWESPSVVRPDPYLSACPWAKDLQEYSPRRASLKKLAAD